MQELEELEKNGYPFKNSGKNLPAVPIFSQLSDVDLLACEIHHTIFSKYHEHLSKGIPSDNLPAGLSEDEVDTFVGDLLNFAGKNLNLSNILGNEENTKKYVKKTVEKFIEKNKGFNDFPNLDKIKDYLNDIGFKSIKNRNVPEEYSKEADNDTCSIMLYGDTCYIAANLKVRESIGKRLEYRTIGLNEEIAENIAQIANNFFTENEKLQCQGLRSISNIIVLKATPKESLGLTASKPAEENAKCHAEMQCLAILKQLTQSSSQDIPFGVSCACCKKCLDKLADSKKFYSKLTFPDFVLDPSDREHTALRSTPNPKNWLDPDAIEVTPLYSLKRVSTASIAHSSSAFTSLPSLPSSYLEVGVVPPSVPMDEPTGIRLKFDEEKKHKYPPPQSLSHDDKHRPLNHNQSLRKIITEQIAPQTFIEPVTRLASMLFPSDGIISITENNDICIKLSESIQLRVETPTTRENRYNFRLMPCGDKQTLPFPRLETIKAATNVDLQAHLPSIVTNIYQSLRIKYLVYSRSYQKQFIPYLYMPVIINNINILQLEIEALALFVKVNFNQKNTELQMGMAICWNGLLLKGEAPNQIGGEWKLSGKWTPPASKTINDFLPGALKHNLPKYLLFIDNLQISGEISTISKQFHFTISSKRVFELCNIQNNIIILSNLEFRLKNHLLSDSKEEKHVQGVDKNFLQLELVGMLTLGSVTLQFSVNIGQVGNFKIEGEVPSKEIKNLFTDFLNPLLKSLLVGQQVNSVWQDISTLLNTTSTLRYAISQELMQFTTDSLSVCLLKQEQAKCNPWVIHIDYHSQDLSKIKDDTEGDFKKAFGTLISRASYCNADVETYGWKKNLEIEVKIPLRAIPGIGELLNTEVYLPIKVETNEKEKKLSGMLSMPGELKLGVLTLNGVNIGCNLEKKPQKPMRAQITFAGRLLIDLGGRMEVDGELIMGIEDQGLKDVSGNFSLKHMNTEFLGIELHELAAEVKYDRQKISAGLSANFSVADDLAKPKLPDMVTTTNPEERKIGVRQGIVKASLGTTILDSFTLEFFGAISIKTISDIVLPIPKRREYARTIQTLQELIPTEISPINDPDFLHKLAACEDQQATSLLSKTKDRLIISLDKSQLAIQTIGQIKLQGILEAFILLDFGLYKDFTLVGSAKPITLLNGFLKINKSIYPSRHLPPPIDVGGPVFYACLPILNIVSNPDQYKDIRIHANAHVELLGCLMDAFLDISTKGIEIRLQLHADLALTLLDNEILLIIDNEIIQFKTNLNLMGITTKAELTVPLFPEGGNSIKVEGELSLALWGLKESIKFDVLLSLGLLKEFKNDAHGFFDTVSKWVSQHIFNNTILETETLLSNSSELLEVNDERKYKVYSSFLASPTSALSSSIGPMNLLHALNGYYGEKQYQYWFNWISANKYQHHYAVVLSFLARLTIQSGNNQAMAAFWPALLSPPYDITGSAHLRLIVRCLEAAQCEQGIPYRDQLLGEVQLWAKKTLATKFADRWFWTLLGQNPRVLQHTAILETLIDKEPAWHELGQLGAVAATPKVVAAALAALKNQNDTSQRSGAATALGQLGVAAATSEVLIALVASLKDKETHVIDCAEGSLTQLGATTAKSKVIAALIASLNDRTVRSRSARVLGLLGAAAATPEVLTALIDIALKESDSSESDFYATEALCGFGIAAATPKVVASLITALKSQQTYKTRRNALKIFSQLGTAAIGTQEEVVAVLVAALNDWSDQGWDLMEYAAEALSKLELTTANKQETLSALNKALLILVKVALNPKNGKKSWDATKTLGKLGAIAATKILDILTAKLENSDKGVREQAAKVLIRKVAITSLGQLGAKAVTLKKKEAIDEVVAALVTALNKQNGCSCIFMLENDKKLLESKVFPDENTIRVKVRTDWQPSEGIIYVKANQAYWCENGTFKPHPIYLAHRLSQLITYDKPVHHDEVNFKEITSLLDYTHQYNESIQLCAIQSLGKLGMAAATPEVADALATVMKRERNSDFIRSALIVLKQLGAAVITSEILNILAGKLFSICNANDARELLELLDSLITATTLPLCTDYFLNNFNEVNRRTRMEITFKNVPLSLLIELYLSKEMQKKSSGPVSHNPWLPLIVNHMTYHTETSLAIHGNTLQVITGTNTVSLSLENHLLIQPLVHALQEQRAQLRLPFLRTWDSCIGKTALREQKTETSATENPLKKAAGHYDYVPYDVNKNSGHRFFSSSSSSSSSNHPSSAFTTSLSSPSLVTGSSEIKKENKKNQPFSFTSTSHNPGRFLPQSVLSPQIQTKTSSQTLLKLEETSSDSRSNNSPVLTRLPKRYKK